MKMTDHTPNTELHRDITVVNKYLERDESSSSSSSSSSSNDSLTKKKKKRKKPRIITTTLKEFRALLPASSSSSSFFQQQSPPLISPSLTAAWMNVTLLQLQPATALPTDRLERRHSLPDLMTPGTTSIRTALERQNSLPFEERSRVVQFAEDEPSITSFEREYLDDEKTSLWYTQEEIQAFRASNPPALAARLDLLKALLDEIIRMEYRTALSETELGITNPFVDRNKIMLPLNKQQLIYSMERLKIRQEAVAVARNNQSLQQQGRDLRSLLQRHEEQLTRQEARLGISNPFPPDSFNSFFAGSANAPVTPLQLSAMNERLEFRHQMIEKALDKLQKSTSNQQIIISTTNDGNDNCCCSCGRHNNHHELHLKKDEDDSLTQRTCDDSSSFASVELDPKP